MIPGLEKLSEIQLLILCVVVAIGILLEVIYLRVMSDREALKPTPIRQKPNYTWVR